MTPAPWCLPAALALSAALFASSPAAASCDHLYNEAQSAQTAGDIGALKSLFEKAATDPSCSDAFRVQFGRVVARSIEKRVYEAAAAGKPIQPFESDLKDSERYARLWRPLAWLGDIERDRKDYTAAARYYQAALEVIRDETATPKPPAPEVIEQVFHRAEQMQLLSRDYVASPITRAEKPTGLATGSFRGFTPTRVAVPIEFQYDSVRFTGKGDAAAKDLLEQLRAQGFPPITLIGHTDPLGGAEYNLRLSERRAMAVRTFLLEAGYTGAILVEGRGESEPLQVDDPGKYHPEELHQIYRRVELRR